MILCKVGLHGWKLLGYYSMYRRRVLGCRCGRKKIETERRTAAGVEWRIAAVFPSGFLND